jgi:long-chain acyl-CoA synthetase
MSQLSRIFQESLTKFKKRRYVSLKKDFVYDRYSFGDIHDYSLKLITLFKENKIKKGDMIGICSYNCPQYFYSYIACVFSGVTLVPMDFSSSEELMDKFIEKTNAKLLITSVKKITNLKIKKYYVEELDEILKDKKPGKITLTKEDDLLEIMFTSGTTGEPKGVMIKHQNVYTNVLAALDCFWVGKNDNFLSIVPMSHILEQLLFLAVSIKGASITQLRSRRGSEIVKALEKEKPTMLAAVPAFFNLFKRKIEEKAKEKNKLDKLNKMMDIASFLSFPMRRKLFKKVHTVFGGRLNTVICGGAALPVDTEIFFEKIGIKVINGYGLTETSPLLTGNQVNNKKHGSAGMAVKGVKLKISKQGEILAKGKNITLGYYKNPEATKKLFTKDGWLKTGDIGDIDEDGFLFIRGRLKNMILKQNGLNVYPEDIEKILDKEPLIKESCVVGVKKGNDSIITAAVLLSEKTSKEEIQKTIDKVNKKLETHQKIQDFAVWKKKDFPRSFSMKVKKIEVLKTLETNSNVKSESSDQLINILSTISHVDSKKITENSKLYSDLGFDSLKVIELGSMIEEIIRVEIDEYLIDTKTTVDDLRKMIEKGKQEKAEKKISKRMFKKIFMPIRAVFPEFMYGLASFYFTKVTVKGRKNLNGINEPIIIIFNHTSHLDAHVISKHLPVKIRSRVATGAAADYFFKDSKKIKDWLLARFFRYFMGAFPVARDGKETKSSLKKTFEYIQEAVDNGWNICLSPEGTRTRTGEVGKFKAGIGLIVKETGYKVLPIKLRGLFEIMPPGKNLPVKRGPAEIKFGKLISFPSSASPTEITNELEKVIREM